MTKPKSASIPAITIKDFERNPADYLWMKNDTLVIDSIFQKSFLGDLKTLLCCVEDNIKDDGIDYLQAITDYKKNDQTK